jgi:hypothetical protein
MRHLAPLLATLLLLAQPASALIMVGGKDPVTDHDWPAGSLDLANHKSRLAWYEGPPFGGGEWTFLYRGDTATLNVLLTTFAQIKAPDLLLIVHDGVHNSSFLPADKNAKPDTTVDWSFTVWTPQNFYQLFADPAGFMAAQQPQYAGALPPPRMDVYVAEGRIDWERVQVPAGVRIVDERALAHGYKPEDGSVVVGTVYDMLTSKPVAGVEVTAEHQVQPPQPPDNFDVSKNPPKPSWEKVASTIGDADGRFELKNIPAGGYQLVVRCTGYAPRALEWISFEAHTYKSFPAIQLSPAIEATGKVLDSTTNRPLPGVKVRVDQTLAADGRGYPQPEGRETTTDAEGKFTLSNLPRGQAQITAWADGHYQADMLKKHPIAGKPITLKMGATGTIHVKVTATRDG